MLLIFVPGLRNYNDFCLRFWIFRVAKWWGSFNYYFSLLVYWNLNLFPFASLKFEFFVVDHLIRSLKRSFYPKLHSLSLVCAKYSQFPKLHEFIKASIFSGLSTKFFCFSQCIDILYFLSAYWRGLKTYHFNPKHAPRKLGPAPSRAHKKTCSRFKTFTIWGFVFLSSLNNLY